MATTMKRDCDSCHKNNTEEEFGCPYIQKEPQVFYDFPLYGDPEFGIYGCPIYYKREDTEIMKLYSDIADGLIAKDKLYYNGRIIYRAISGYFQLEELSKRKK